jgi:excisionase family DNA binding protein
MTTDELITLAQAANRLGITRQRLHRLISTGRVPTAIRIGKYWLLPRSFNITEPKKGN